MKKVLILLISLLSIFAFRVNALEMTKDNDSLRDYIMDEFSIEEPIASSTGQILGKAYSTRVDNFRVDINEDGLDLIVTYTFNMFFEFDFDIKVNYLLNDDNLELNSVYLGIFKSPAFLNDNVLSLLKNLSFDLTSINTKSIFKKAKSVVFQDDKLIVYYNEDDTIDDEVNYDDANSDFVEIVDNKITLDENGLNEFINHEDFRKIIKEKYQIDGLQYQDGKLYLYQNHNDIIIECDLGFENNKIVFAYGDIYRNNIRLDNDEIRDYFNKYEVLFNSFRDKFYLDTDIFDTYISKHTNYDVYINNFIVRDDEYVISLHTVSNDEN